MKTTAQLEKQHQFKIQVKPNTWQALTRMFSYLFLLLCFHLSSYITNLKISVLAFVSR
jgi:hypothetical protein